MRGTIKSIRTEIVTEEQYRRDRLDRFVAAALTGILARADTDPEGWGTNSKQAIGQGANVLAELERREKEGNK